MDVLMNAEQREALLVLNNPSIAADLSLKCSGHRHWLARLLSRQIKPVLITPDSCITTVIAHAAGVWRPFREKGRAVHMPSGERNSDSHSPPSPNLNGQSCICEIVCLLDGLRKNVFLSGWQICSYLCSRSEKSGIFKQQGWQMTTFSPVITAKVWRCCNIWCVHHSKWIFKAAASSILTCSNQSF